MIPRDKTEFPEYLEQGTYARLIPVVADTSREQRITSTVMAGFMSVEEFGREMLKLVGAPATKTAKITCYTEVVFKKVGDEQQKFRPDGLIIVKSGARTWTAIVEAKIGGAQLNRDQIEAYLDLARLHGMHAVITISNQFAALPTHHPISVSKQKLRSVSLYHWSWTSIVAQAIMLADNKGISDPDQAYILNELIRYLQHDNSKVASFSRMGPLWKDLCNAVQHDVALSKNNPYVIDSVKDWHQLVRYISIKMSQRVGHNVPVIMSRAQERDLNIRLQDDIAFLVSHNRLESLFNVPHAAANIRFIADIKSRTLHVSMRLKAPTDKSRAAALVTWALRQVAKCEDEFLLIRAIWPGRTPDTGVSLGQLREDPKLIIQDNPGLMPVAFEYVRVIDIAGNFKGASKFVESAVIAVPVFYKEIGQNLKAWVPSAPKVGDVEETTEQIIARVSKEPSGVEATPELSKTIIPEQVSQIAPFTKMIDPPLSAEERLVKHMLADNEPQSEEEAVAENEAAFES